MTKVIYKIVKHEGGYAYTANGTFSEAFISHDAAKTAATTAAREQQQPGAGSGISWEDASGVWHEELADGDDRPETVVEG